MKWRGMKSRQLFAKNYVNPDYPAILKMSCLRETQLFARSPGLRASFDGYDELPLKPVFEQLEGRICYGKLRLYRALNARQLVS